VVEVPQSNTEGVLSYTSHANNSWWSDISYSKSLLGRTVQ